MNATAHYSINTRGVIPVIVVFLILGLYYSYITPLWNPPDEERHFAYCEYIAQHHSLPYLDPHDEGLHITEATHPPLFYMLGSLFCKNDGQTIHELITFNDGPGYIELLHPQEEVKFPYAGKARSAYLIRLLSIFFSAVTIYFIYKLTLAIFSGEKTLAAAAALFAAINPQFIHIAASVSNEPLSTTFVTILLFALVQYLLGQNTRKHQVIIGILLGCALLTKLSALVYIPAIFLVFMKGFYQRRKETIVALSVVLLLAFFISGWWYLRNWLLFGDPVFSKALITLLPFTPRYSIVMANSVRELKIMFTSFFGFFGALQIPISAFHIGVYAVFVVLGTVGLCRIFIKRALSSCQKEVMYIICLTILSGLGFILMLNLKAYVYSGKYFFIIIAPISICVCLGFQSLFQQHKNKALFISMLILLIVNLDILIRILIPAYKKPRVVEYIAQPEFCCRTDAISRSSTIGQTFYSSKDNICAIRVMFANLNAFGYKKIKFALREGSPQGRLLKQIDLPIENINNTRFFFIFPPIKNSAGKYYSFSFSCSSKSAYGLSLWYSSTDFYPDGQMFINNKPLSGDLFFTVYHFTGDQPQNVWEGIKATVIRQEEYIGVREWQLYVELPKKLKEKSYMQKKIQRTKQFMIQ